MFLSRGYETWKNCGRVSNSCNEAIRLHNKMSAVRRSDTVNGKTAVTPFRIFVVLPRVVLRYYPCLRFGQEHIYNAAWRAKKFNPVIRLVGRVQVQTTVKRQTSGCSELLPPIPLGGLP